MTRSIDEKELERLLQSARAAGDAEGYARAKFEITLETAKGAVVTAPTTPDAPIALAAPPIEILSQPKPSKVEKLESFRLEAEQAKENETYKTRITVTMTQAIALDYIKSVTPRVVGPSEIKKNSERSLDIFISFGTLQRAMAKLVEIGDVELVESSRWRFKNRSDTSALRSVK